MHAIQLDTRSGFYEFYQRLALSVLTEQQIQAKPVLLEIKKALLNWEGTAAFDSKGFGILVEFRQRLADLVFPLICNAAGKLTDNLNIPGLTWIPP